jgi:hypothetical protein
MTMRSETVKAILAQYDHENRVELSPRDGYLRINYMNNDVYWAIDKIGGVRAASGVLGVTPEQVETWIDQHYVPHPFASTINRLTGYSIWSIQEPTFYVFDGNEFWPHTPAKNELTRKIGAALPYCWIDNKEGIIRRSTKIKMHKLCRPVDQH